MDDFLTVGQAATLLQVSPATVRRWIAQAELPAYRVGQRRVRLKRTDLEHFLTPVPPGPFSRASDRSNSPPLPTRFEPPPITAAHKRRALEAVAAARQLQKDLLERYGPFENSAD